MCASAPDPAPPSGERGSRTPGPVPGGNATSGCSGILLRSWPAGSGTGRCVPGCGSGPSVVHRAPGPSGPRGNGGPAHFRLPGRVRACPAAGRGCRCGIPSMIPATPCGGASGASRQAVRGHDRVAPVAALVAMTASPGSEGSWWGLRCRSVRGACGSPAVRQVADRPFRVFPAVIPGVMAVSGRCFIGGLVAGADQRVVPGRPAPRIRGARFSPGRDIGGSPAIRRTAGRPIPVFSSSVFEVFFGCFGSPRFVLGCFRFLGCFTACPGVLWTGNPARFGRAVYFCHGGGLAWPGWMEGGFSGLRTMMRVAPGCVKRKTPPPGFRAVRGPGASPGPGAVFLLWERGRTHAGACAGRCPAGVPLVPGGLRKGRTARFRPGGGSRPG